MSYVWPEVGWAPSTVTTPISTGTVIPPQYIQDELARIGTPWDATKYEWDQYGMNLIDRATGNRYSYANIADPSLGTDVVTNLTNYNASGPGAEGTFHFDEGVNPFIAFPGENYNAGLVPGSGIFLSADPAEIAEYGSSARDRNWQGIARVGAVVGGGAALGATGSGPLFGGAAPAGGSGAVGGYTGGGGSGVLSTSIPGDLGAFISEGAAAQTAGSAAAAAGAGGGVGGAIMNNLPAIISGASSLIGGTLASNAAEDASDAMLQANREAIDYQRESRDLALGLLEPERQSANAAMARMLQMQGLPIPASLQAALDESGVKLGDFNVADTPGYRFRLDEAMDALETSAFARGGGMAGGFGEHALRYAQDYASNEYHNIYNQLATLTGRNTSSSGANVALNFGGNAAAITQDSGAARASGYVAQSNAWQNALDQISQLPWDQWFPGKRKQVALAYGG